MMKNLKNSLIKNSRSYRFAVKGVFYASKYENNFRYQLLAGLIVIIAGIYIKLSTRSWLIITVLIGLVLMAELFNTAIEKLADILYPDHHPEIEKVKDIAAGAVLIISISALIAGVIILADHYLLL